ncbi:hypothetical protein LSH36_638g01004 [Paralvinella palmiformis]|uniref:Fibrinogen C-terminal domain-containing protein n=1 Tax=Paralvinella palmiformis TaxID=53620 RepID=A0AAD9J4L4_9ANNE|nr:hypothetical protein LSH36_638g01004 [Paralvinella palmiformis]
MPNGTTIRTDALDRTSPVACTQRDKSQTCTTGCYIGLTRIAFVIDIKSVDFGIGNCYLSVRSDYLSIIPDEERYLTDESPQTCASFNISSEVNTPRYTQFRVQLDDDQFIEQVTVTLIGTNLGCGHGLYVSPLSATETSTWTGLWMTCQLENRSSYEDKQMCFYECPCLASCKEIQIMKYPKVIMDSPWTLCHMCITYPTVINQCSDVTSSGIYKVNIKDTSVCMYRDIYCDMETDGGGWTVLMVRKDGSVDFNKDWQEYKLGFGSLDGEFWAGNELIHKLTSDGRTYTLRVDLINYANDARYAKYGSFSVGPESDNYTLLLNVFDTSSTLHNKFIYHSNCMFSTPSIDNDQNKNDHMSLTYQAPWWFCEINDIILTGSYGRSTDISPATGIKWYGPWDRLTYAKHAVMMIRPN